MTAPTSRADVFPKRVVVWITREGDGQVEQHVGPFYRWVRAANGRPLLDPETGYEIEDQAYAEAVLELLGGYDGRSARDVANDITVKSVERDETGALRYLTTALFDIAKRVLERNRRGERGTLRALHLADVELEQMTVHVRAE